MFTTDLKLEFTEHVHYHFFQNSDFRKNNPSNLKCVETLKILKIIYSS